MLLSEELYFKYRRIWMHQEIEEEVHNQYEINYRNVISEGQHFYLF